MKTIGEILRESRKDRGYTPVQLSSLTKIDVRYIEALEENDFKKMPSATFTKGFVRNLAISLGKDPSDWVALLRRDYQASTPPTVSPPRRNRRFSISSLIQSRSLLIVLGAVVFVTYLVFQYRAVITPPPLDISSPTKDAVTISPVILKGLTSSGTTVIINDDLRLVPDSSGHFQTKLNLSPGTSDIKISVVNRFSRSTTKIIPLTILSQ